MNNNGIVQIHGRDYMTVARRIELSHADRALESVETEVLNHNPVVVRAKVIIKGRLFTGISSVNPDSQRQIEKQNPYEVAETSAVGRALGFAGYGLLESIASADEVIRAQHANLPFPPLSGKGTQTSSSVPNADENAVNCKVCGQPAVERRGTTKGGKSYHGIFCTTQDKSHTRWMWS